MQIRISSDSIVINDFYIKKLNYEEISMSNLKDYFLVSQGLEDKLVSANILSDVIGSDHCPVELVVK